MKKRIVFSLLVLGIMLSRNTAITNAQNKVVVIPLVADSIIGVPIGAVIDWWRPDAAWPVPDGFQMCDGTNVSDPSSPLYGKTLPNLNGRFILGTTDVNDIGTFGGSITHNHTVDINHNHLATNTDTAGSHNHKWSEFWNLSNGDKQWITFQSNGSPRLTTIWNDGIGNEGSGHYPLSEYYSNDFYTLYGGSHSHAVDLPALGTQFKGTSSSENYPPYFGLLKIMRIK